DKETKTKKIDTLKSLNSVLRNLIGDYMHELYFETEKQNKPASFLELAMDWDCIHVAKEFVLKNSLTNIPNQEEAFIKALDKNLPTFIYEFLRLGMDPAEIFFPPIKISSKQSRYKKFFENLYHDGAVNRDQTHIKYFINSDKETKTKKIDTLKSLNSVLRNLIGDYMHELYFETEEEETRDRIKWGLIKSSVQSQSYNYDDIDKRYQSYEEIKRYTHKYIIRDLFLWAILMNYIDMAKVFLSFLKYRICSALIATKILKKYHSVAIYGELKDNYEKNIKYFEKYAINCLDKCDNHDRNRTCNIVLQRNELYGYVTCLQVASDANDKLFISTPSCVEAMRNVLYDKLYPEQTSTKNRGSLFIGFISLGLFASYLVQYREIEMEKEVGESLKPTLEPHGINYSDPYSLEYPRCIKTMPNLSRHIHRLKNFHLSVLTKYCYHVVFYIFFLLLFSYVLLFNFSPPTNTNPSIHWTEILTIIFVSFMLLEEIHYFFTQDNLTFLGQLKHFFGDFFKSMTTLAFILFYLGLILRFRYADTEEKFVVARVIMAFDIEIWWLRCMTFIIVIPYLGPHLVAIGKMIYDLLFFMCIIGIVIIAYGVASRSMVYYPKVNNFTRETGGPIDASFDGRSVFRQIIYPVYYLLYGEFHTQLDDLDNNSNAGWSITNHILLAIHMLFLNILLINLLIAMFSKRFNQTYEETRQIWHSQRYLLIREYFTRSPFIPPISFMWNIYYLIRMLVFFIKRTVSNPSADYEAKVFKMIAKDISISNKWREFEGASTYDYAHDEVKALNAVSMKSLSALDEFQDNLLKLSSTIDQMEIEFDEDCK
ncbi:unnamed protein product, partial [Rotaria sp. Silwood1]